MKVSVVDEAERVILELNIDVGDKKKLDRDSENEPARIPSIHTRAVTAIYSRTSADLFLVSCVIE